MLNSIRIQNFRSCDDVSLRLGEPIVALLGKNGAGKTNLLHAIQVAANLCAGSPNLIVPVDSHDQGKPTEFELSFALDSYDYTYRTSLPDRDQRSSALQETLERNGDVQFERVDDKLSVIGVKTDMPNIRMPETLSALFVLKQLLPKSELQSALEQIFGYLTAVRYYPLAQHSQEPFERPELPFLDSVGYVRWRTTLESGRPGPSVTNRLLHMHLTKDGSLDELRKLVGHDGLGLVAEIRIDEIELKRASGKAGRTTVGGEKAYSIVFVPCEGIAGAGRTFGYGGLSAGTWRVIRLLTYLVFDASSCMLVEQPEDSIHAGLLEKLIDILSTYSSRTQLICTTHSPRVMNLVGPAGIRVVTADNGRTQVTELTRNQIEMSQEYLQDEGTLAEFLETL